MKSLFPTLLLLCLACIGAKGDTAGWFMEPEAVTVANYPWIGRPQSCLENRYIPSFFAVRKDHAPPGGYDSYKENPELIASYPTERIYQVSWNETAQAFNWTKFFVKGVGYSPIPPSKYTMDEPFDRFTSEYKFLWKRDLDQIRAMGVNVVRLWSWDAFRDHSSFLDECYKRGLYVMVPFMFDHRDYIFIDTPASQGEILTNFRAFVESVMNHPAVFCFLVGNELNTYYGSQREALFTILNSMIRIRNEVDPARHLVTIPLADVAFVEVYSNHFYPYSGIDFWSVQSYRKKEYIAIPIREYYKSWLVNMTVRNMTYLKPLVFTEFGVDSLPEFQWRTATNPPGLNFTIEVPEDQPKQADFFCAMFTQMRSQAFIVPQTTPTSGSSSQGQDSSIDIPGVPTAVSYAQVVGGVVVMEWNDEWWKGTYADVRNNMCPNTRTELHTPCSHDIGTPQDPYYLYEEFLGINLQVYDETRKKLCVCPRIAYFAMKAAYQCNGNGSDCLPNLGAGDYQFGSINSESLNGFGCNSTDTGLVGILTNERDTCARNMYCAYRDGLLENPYFTIVGPPAILVVILLIVTLCLSCRRKKVSGTTGPSEATPAKQLTDDDWQSADLEHRQEQLQTSTNGRNLRAKIAMQFLSFCTVGTTDRLETDYAFCPYFQAAQERLFILIWDKYLGFESHGEQYLQVATRIVYEQYMEGYFLWLGEPPQSIGLDEMIRDLALFSIVQTWAGTICHCPEKICEVFEFSKSWFEHAVPDRHSSSRVTCIQDFHHGLVEIFRMYYLKVDHAEFTYEDVNTDALHFRRARSSRSAEEKIRQFWVEEDNNRRTMLLDPSADQVVQAAQRDPESIRKNTGKDCPELDLLPAPSLEGQKPLLHPYLEYHKQRNPEATLLSDCAQGFIQLHQLVTGQKWMKPHEAFKQKGGPFTLLFNYSWIVRYLIWQDIWAKFWQPVSIAAPLCVTTVTEILALVDSIWMFLTFLMHYRVLGRFTKRLVFEGVVQTLLMLAVVGLFALKYTNVSVSISTSSQVKELNSVKTDFDMSVKVLGFVISPFTAYLFITGLITGIDELRLLLRPPLCADIPARFGDRGALVRIRVVFYITLLSIAAAMSALWLPVFPVDGEQQSMMDFFQTIISPSQWPNVVIYIWGFTFAFLTCAVPYGLARCFGRLSGTGSRRAVTQRKGREEANYLVLSYIFWAVFIVANWLLAYELLVPSINNISFNTCRCDPANPQLSESERHICKETFAITCFLAVAFTWLSAFLVSFVALYAVFELELLIFGVARAKANRVGNVMSWADVEKSWEVIQNRATRTISSCMLVPEKQVNHWNLFVKALFDDCLLNDKEMKDLTVKEVGKAPNFRNKPRSAEAVRRIIYHLWSLESALAHDEVGGTDIHNRIRRFHRVRTMPTWTCVVPAYNEPIVFDESQLIKSRTEGKTSLRITEIEYLSHMYPDEWANLCERIKAKDSSWVVAADNFTQDLLAAFLKTPGHPRLADWIRFEIRWWASMRGQTLGRTIQGLINWRNALLELLKMEENKISDIDAQRIVSRKCQIVISHQTYSPNKNILQDLDCPSEEAMEIVFRRLKYFDLVYNDDSTFQSVCKRLNPEYLYTAPDGQEDIQFSKVVTLKDGKTERTIYNYYPPEAFETRTVQRVGRLKIGEGKAENQMHALQFVNGMVMQAMDMNQYATFENGLKVPYILGDFYNTPHNLGMGENWEHETLIPPFRILGFPEWAYTRSLSLVGEMMGAAEWCFVTITHRVLDWPLRLRLHYGHPDFFDAFWVRNRGGQSKASPIVNTNEDIFAGYEMLARGDRGSFIEFLEAQKGRETTFPGAFTFEGKLAQGGAQQVRSYDVYRLNRGLDVITRFGLFFTTLAFYLTNLLMSVSINYYILSIALFAIGGVSYHKLGLLDAVIAVPWLIQIGYVLALPLLVELTLQKGFWKALAHFISILPPSVLFFIFHMRTKTCYFTQGLLIGKGGYAGTGRGFGLDRNTFVEIYKNYSESHFHEALLIMTVLIIYAIYGSDPPGAYFLRTFTLWLIVISWLWAPIFFNPAATTHDLATDAKEMMHWISAKRSPERSLTDVKNFLTKVHVSRLLKLVSNLMEDCKNHLKENKIELPGGKQDGLDPTQRRDESLRSFGVAAELKASRSPELTQALSTALDILARSKDKLMGHLGKMSNPGEKVDGVGYEKALEQYWGSQEKESWKGWWLKGVVIMQWEAEDQFFPGLINLMFQKLYLNVELFLPWIVLASDYFHIDSLWFLYLTIMGIGVQYLVDFGFKDHHEYSTLAKATFLFCVPLPIIYYHYSIMKFQQLLWSMILYSLITMLLVRAIYGTVNAVAKFRTFGLSGNPYTVSFSADFVKTDSPAESLQVSIWNRMEEMEVTNNVEAKRYRLFAHRLQYINYITAFRNLIPLVCAAILVVGNLIAVVLSDWITTINFNGRVNEAWKKAYLRPPLATTQETKPPPPSQKPLTQKAEQTQDEAQQAQAAVYGSLAASLEPAGRRTAGIGRSRNTLQAASSRFVAMPSAPAPGSSGGVRTSSFHSIPEEVNESLSERLLRERHTDTGASQRSESGVGEHRGPRQQMHFLANIADKYRR
jgi:hypothetical protein